MIAKAMLEANEHEVISPFCPFSCPPSSSQCLTGSQLAKEGCGVQRPSPEISMQTTGAGLGAMRQ